MAHRILHKLRIASQAAFFALFVYLLIRTRVSGSEVIGPVERIFHFDPLLGLVAIVASRSLQTAFLWALISVALTVVLGRYLCGWVCPFGAVHQFFSFVFKRTRSHVPSHQETRLLHVKYAILAAVLAGSVFALDLAGFLDPLSLLTRSFAVALLPAGVISSQAAATAAGQVGWTSFQQSLGQAMANLAVNRTFQQGLLIGGMFVGFVLLNLHRERFFCRYLCPTGAFLGLLARWNLVKVRIDKSKCNECRACSLHCQTQAAPFPNDGWRPRECVYCYSCSTRCPSGAISFPLTLKRATPKPIDLRRRWGPWRRAWPRTRADVPGVHQQADASGVDSSARHPSRGQIPRGGASSAASA